MHIEAGPSRRRLRENTLFAVALVGLGGYFLYDGFIGYPAENEAVRQEDAREKEKNPDFIPEAELKHSAADITIQKILAALCGVVAVSLVVGVIRSKRTAFVVDDEGLRIDRRPLIPFTAMTALKTDRWDDKGWVDLVYDEGGRTRRVRLDSFKIEPCEPLIAAICERMGFTNPLPPEATEPSAR